MTPTYYMLVYCNDGQDAPTKFLMGIRNQEGYFFHKQRGEVTYIKPQIFAQRQTPGKIVLPGGTPNSHTRGSHLDLANSEFMEETGVNLLDGYGVQLNNDVNVQVINNNRGQPAAYIVQVKLSNDKFRDLQTRINQNMTTKSAKILAIQNRTYQATRTECPILDDELSGVRVLETGTTEFNEALQDMDTLDQGASYKYRGWFAEGIVNCIQRIYNLHVDTTFNDGKNINKWVGDVILQLNEMHRTRRQLDGRRRYEHDDYRRHKLDVRPRREYDDYRRPEFDYRSHREHDNHRRRERDYRHHRRERSRSPR
ncbi:hypothetical protein [Vallitalea guaymasensis]|uniref:Uncharacterized protein n=1 Tax=Vallitalea guaymasensis TaxID=1185412 RepID=A0A8J8ME53_9FIRM|nr:hypothetical protein [Vallitalea guaymasensis]QUH31020.1 hypothetical protein HYG85_19690 [Vallitalea guaymasensis]